MNTMSSYRDGLDDCNHLGSRSTASRLDRAALANGAASRRSRLRAIEAEIDHACERAAIGNCASIRHHDRRQWDRRRWRSYIAEAVQQACIHAPELDALRQEVSQLERLIQATLPRSRWDVDLTSPETAPGKLTAKWHSKSGGGP
jgi:hypothetical protein